MAEDVVLVKKSDFEKIANAARAASGTEDKYSISELADAVANSIVPPSVESNVYLIANENGEVKWKSLPFYEITEEVEKIPETTIAAKTSQWNYSVNYPNLISASDLDYVVYFDGVKYGPYKTNVIDLGGDIGIIATLVLPEDVSNLPFNSFGAGTISIKDTTVSHIIRVAEQKVSVDKKLSKNFLPDDLTLSWEAIKYAPFLQRYGGNDGVQDTTRGVQFGGDNGMSCSASGPFSFAVNYGSTASGRNSTSFGDHTKAQRLDSFAEGDHTDTGLYALHVGGRYNKILSQLDKFTNTVSPSWLQVIGNGTDDNNRSNAYVLDYDGNAWYSGVVEATSFILKSSTPNSVKHFKITVDDNGTLTATETETMEK